jgi:hypothetical protein
VERAESFCFKGKTKYLRLPDNEARNLNQQNHKPSKCMAATHYELTKEPVPIAVTLINRLVELKMSN